MLTVGIQYDTQDPVPTQREVWRAADEAGFDQLWTSDHLAWGKPSFDAPVLDSWTALAAAAADTRRIRLGVLVTGNLYRHPSLLAKIAVTVDHVSRGRLEVGLGTAWNELEFRMLGMPFADAPERASRLDEACVVLKKLWTDDRATYAGRFYQLKDAIAEPKPVQRPHPPILIGGRGPLVTLRAVARHAQAWNTSGGSGFDADREAARILDEHCAKIGRDPASIRRSTYLAWPDADSGLANAERYVALGFSEFILSVGGPEKVLSRETLVRDIDRFARTDLERLRRLA